jgi:proline racemase
MLVALWIYSDSAGNLTAAEATGAHVDVLRSTVNNSLYALDVGLPCAVGTSVRMAYLNAKGNALIAKFTLCHVMLYLHA